MTKPEYPILVTWFKRVPLWQSVCPHWQSVCPHLLDDKDSTKTKEISMMHGGVKEKRDEMLGSFLGMSNPTWEKVVNALRSGGYNNLADDIESELKW